MLANDTDILVLLLYFSWFCKLNAQVTMKKFNAQIFGITATSLKLGESPACIQSIRLCPIRPARRKSAELFYLPRSIWQEDTEEKEWAKEGLRFLSALYGTKLVPSLDG